MDGPIFFTQYRVGKNLKPFKMYKFRSMITNRIEMDSDLSHEEMVTKVGKFIRKTSLDELPQLFNILKGEMAFIGPRPWVDEYYRWFNDEQKRRAEVLPGLSGLAQIKGRNGIGIIEKIKFDVEYVDTMNFKLDVKIFFGTIRQLFKKNEAEITEAGIKEEINELKTKMRFQKKEI